VPEALVAQKAALGTKWVSAVTGGQYYYRVNEIVAVEAVTVPYGTFPEAYKHRHYKCVDPDHLELGQSPDCIDWFVPGVGMVKEEDWWADNAPTTEVLVKLTGVPASFSYHSTEALHIWDIAGTHGDEPSFTVTEDAKGKLGGAGDLNMTVYDNEDRAVEVTSTYTVTGQITQTAGVGKVKLTLRAKGTATRDGATSKWTGTIVVQAQIDPGTSVLSGTVKKSMTAFGEHASETKTFDEPPADGMNGAFTLALDITPNGKKATATAVLTLSSGDTYNFSGKGTFNATRDQYVLTLKSPEKLSLTLYVTASTGEITKLTGKALGQNLLAVNIPVAVD
jgi:hypothetical protein